MQKNETMVVYAATYTYVRRSSLCSCYSQPLLSYVPPCAMPTHANDAYSTHGYSYEATAAWGADLQSGTLFNQCVVAHTAPAGCVANQGQLYRDPMPLTKEMK